MNIDWDNKKLEELAQLIAKYDLTEIEIAEKDNKVCLKRASIPAQLPQQEITNLPMGHTVGGMQKGNVDFKHISEIKAIQDEKTDTDNLTDHYDHRAESVRPASLTSKEGETIVSSPIAGIFYRQSMPGKPPYADIGQHVERGQIVCLVEAMKMINEISATCDGVVKEFFVEDEQFVEFGDPLVLIKKD